jgi:hypothetical protein
LNWSSLDGACIHRKKNRLAALNIIIGPETVCFPEDSGLAAIFNRDTCDAVRCCHGMNVGKCFLLLFRINWLLIEIITGVPPFVTGVVIHHRVAFC